MGTLKKFPWSALGAIVGAWLGRLVWNLALNLVGVDGIRRYFAGPVALWVIVYAGPFIGLLAGGAVGWRRGHGRLEPG